MSGTTKESHFSAVLTLFFTKLLMAKPAWYSIKALSSDIPSLPSLFLGMNYETMIMLFHFTGLGPGGKVFSADKVNYFYFAEQFGPGVLECTHPLPSQRFEWLLCMFWKLRARDE
jgi:hypothetical protein